MPPSSRFHPPFIASPLYRLNPSENRKSTGAQHFLIHTIHSLLFPLNDDHRRETQRPPAEAPKQPHIRRLCCAAASFDAAGRTHARSSPATARRRRILLRRRPASRDSPQNPSQNRPLRHNASPRHREYCWCCGLRRQPHRQVEAGKASAGVEMAVIDAVANSILIPFWRLFEGVSNIVTTYGHQTIICVHTDGWECLCDASVAAVDKYRVAVAADESILCLLDAQK